MITAWIMKLNILWLRRILLFVVDHWIGVLLAIALLVAVFFGYKACRREVKIDEEQIQRINKANEIERREELKKVITENQDVIRTAENRTIATDASIAERERQIDAKVKEADAKIVEIKQQKGDVSQEELVCLLQPETCK